MVQGSWRGDCSFFLSSSLDVSFPGPNTLGRNIFAASSERTFISVGIRILSFQSFAHSLKEDKETRQTLGTSIFPFALQVVTV